MAKLIVKSPYIKGGGNGGAGRHLKYIGTREGVEKLEQQPSGYMVYIAERPHSHGLFGDEDKAVEYLTQAAEAGNQYAQYALGKLYLAGEEVKQDVEAAHYWFTQSAAQGNSCAQFFLNRWNNL